MDDKEEDGDEGYLLTQKLLNSKENLILGDLEFQILFLFFSKYNERLRL